MLISVYTMGIAIFFLKPWHNNTDKILGKNADFLYDTIESYIKELEATTSTGQYIFWKAKKQTLLDLEYWRP